MTKGHFPGGGPASNKITERPVKTGSGSKGISPGWVGQKGELQGTHTTNRGETSYRGEQKFTGQNFNPTPYGNEVAASTKCGVGGSRAIYKTGSQQQYGSGGPQKPAGRDILSEFGPNKREY